MIIEQFFHTFLVNHHLKKRMKLYDEKNKTTKDGSNYAIHEPPDNSRYCAKHTFSLHASDISTGELNTSPELGAYTPDL